MDRIRLLVPLYKTIHDPKRENVSEEPAQNQTEAGKQHLTTGHCFVAARVPGARIFLFGTCVGGNNDASIEFRCHACNALQHFAREFFLHAPHFSVPLDRGDL